MCAHILHRVQKVDYVYAKENYSTAPMSKNVETNEI